MTMIQNRSERNCVDRESKHFDELLATALTPDVQPERALDEQILRRVKEEAQMKEEMKNGLKMPLLYKIKKLSFLIFHEEQECLKNLA